MLTEKEIDLVELNVTLQRDSEWKKIDTALGNVKIADIQTAFSLPIEFSETFDQVPRKMLKSRDEVSIITVSPKRIGFVFNWRGVSKTLKEKVEPPVQKDSVAIFHEAESNFDLYFGVYLRAVSQPTESADVDWRIRFRLGQNNHLIKSMIEPSFLKRLMDFDTNAKSDITKIQLSQQKDEERTSYEVIESAEQNTTNLTIRRTFKSDPAKVNLVNLVHEYIKNGNDFLTVIGAGE